MADTVAFLPIPWTAWAAARRAIISHEPHDTHTQFVDAVVKAVWPHLYAAALRYAADTAFQTGDRYIDGRPALFALDAENRLRRMADEASRG